MGWDFFGVALVASKAKFPCKGNGEGEEKRGVPLPSPWLKKKHCTMHINLLGRRKGRGEGVGVGRKVSKAGLGEGVEGWGGFGVPVAIRDN